MKGIFVVYPEKEYVQQVKDSMKAYLDSKGVEVGKQNFVVVVVDFMSFITSPPPPPTSLKFQKALAHQKSQRRTTTAKLPWMALLMLRTDMW